MSEPETNPPRQPVDPDAEPSRPTAELPRLDRGQSGIAPTAGESPALGSDVPRSASDAAAPGTPAASRATSGSETPAGVTASAAEAAPAGPKAAPAGPKAAPAGPKAAPAGPKAAPAGPAVPGPEMPAGPAVSGPVVPGTGSVPATGGDGRDAPPAAPPAVPGPAIPQQGIAEGGAQGPTTPPGPFPPSPWQPHAAHHNQSGWTGNPSYPASGQPSYAPHMPQPVSGPWAPGPVTAVPAARPSRLGKIAAVGAAALVLMTGSGVAGGLATWALTHNSAPATKTYTAAPIIDSADLPGIAAKVENSVVSITTGSGEGSGVVLTADGYVLTNNHVVASASGDVVQVVLADGKTVRAKIKGTDPRTDLAVVKAEGVSGLTPAKFGDSDAMRVGDTVLALGSPLGLQGSVTAGIISARDRTIQAGDSGRQSGATSISGLLQTDAPINPGNSGGALVNTRGEVIGINTAIATAGQSNGNIGVGFAIPSNKAEQVAAALRNGEKVSHPYLGVSVTRSDSGGAVVEAISPGSPAEKAGLQRGDVITRFDGKVINDQEDLVAAVQGGKVGDQVELTYTRNGTENTATVTLAETS